MEGEKLDNPVWHALNEVHADFALKFGEIQFYKPEYCPFGGFTSLENTSQGVDQYAAMIADFFVVGLRPDFSENLMLKQELICNQMVLENPLEFESTEKIIPIQGDLLEELIALVNLVQPGYFKRNTPELGNYYGIFQDGKLVAATGERMKMHDYTEISAVVTHPDHAGKGYAKQLVSFTANKVFEANKIPFLHVAESNIGVVKLYEKLGFETRRKISFWNLNRK